MLQTQTVTANTLSLLKRLRNLAELENFDLVGGTALSLKYGHRSSIDLDLFSNKQFDHSTIVNALIVEFGQQLVIESQHNKWGIFCFIDNIKVDIVYYPHPKIKKTNIIDGIRFYSTEDIIAMKLNAILGRGKKKYFFDLDELFHHYNLGDMIAFHRQKFPSQYLLITIPEALIYFADAEDSEAPKSLKGQTWEKVKENIQRKVRDFLS